MTHEEMAREITLKIWGSSPLPHEYGSIRDRQVAESQHKARIHTTTELISEALASAEKKGREEGILKAREDRYDEEILEEIKIH